MTSEILHRVAKAICCSEGCKWPGMCAAVGIIAQKRARAAIEALRVPTPAMVDAGWEECGGTSPHEVENIWAAMHAEALK